MAYVVVDIQNCFMTTGPLHADNAQGIVPRVNKIRKTYEDEISLVVLVQDLHCADDAVFASQHPGKDPFDVVTFTYNDKGRP